LCSSVSGPALVAAARISSKRGQVIGALGQVRACAVEAFSGARPHAGAARIGMLAVRSQSLREHGEDLRRIVAPRRRLEIEVFLSDIAVHAEEGVERAREFRAALGDRRA